MSQSEKQGKQGRLGNIKTVIYGRTAIILLAFVAQLVVLALGYVQLRRYSIWFYVLFLIISAVAVLHIFNTRGNPDMKLSWMFLIAIFPIFGAIFYVTIIMQPGTKVMRNRLKNLADITKEHITGDKKVWDELRQESPHMGQLSYYLYHRDNSPVYTDTQVKYYALGDEQFPDMVEALEQAKEYIFVEFFIVSEGRMWDTIHEILKRKAAEGVEVRFMYDGTDVLFNLPNSYPKLLEKEGIHCKMFAPIKPIFSPHYNNRDHTRCLWWTEKWHLPAESIWRMNISMRRYGSDTGRIRVSGFRERQWSGLSICFWKCGTYRKSSRSSMKNIPVLNRRELSRMAM